MTGFSLEAGLESAGARIADAVSSLRAGHRVHLQGLGGSSAAYLLARAGLSEPALVVTPDLSAAQRMVDDLGFFLGHRDGVLLYPSSDASPYLRVAPDRRSAMERLSVLAHLGRDLPFRFLVAPAAALLRRVAPRSAIAALSSEVEAEEELDRDTFIAQLTEAGYLRVPIAEDPGTFAVRGSILDVFVPNLARPARIELDDWLVLSIRLFDPDTQRTIEQVPRLFVPPVRDTVAPAKATHVRDRIRELCDEVDLPSAEARRLAEDIEAGRAFHGVDGFLPAFHEQLDTFFDYLPAPTHAFLMHPADAGARVDSTIEEARRDRNAERGAGRPAYPLARHYMDADELAERIGARKLCVMHRLAVTGGGGEDTTDREPEEALSPFAALAPATPEEVLRLDAVDHRALCATMDARRKHGDHGLEVLAERANAWVEQGLQVVFVVRSTTQAERTATLLRSNDLPVKLAKDAFDLARAHRPGTPATVVTGTLGAGFLLATEGLCLVAEQEIYGTRRRPRPKRARDTTAPFLEDLRELQVGDFVVHVEHGIGRYLGLERKVLGQSQLDRMRGVAPLSVEVLTIEYAGGDRLFLPVTRLNQVQKLSGKEGHAPRIDKLGGQSFAKTKARVQKKVQKLADDLLRLYAERATVEKLPLDPPGLEYAELEASFPFEETADQARAIEEVLEDLERSRPMDRVVCGDVGFGKTEVAMRAAFRMAMSGRQVAVLCPTTVLAQQHFSTFRDRLANYPLNIHVLSRFVNRADQAETIGKLKSGTADIVIGTHRLLSKDVHFAKLGLLVVDEEQRFGVTHKERIKKLRTEVDVLSLSATPIPRTLQMAVGGLRDLSLIATPPVDRRAVRTFATRWNDHVLREAISRELERGGQVFFVHNRIDGLYEFATRLQQLVPDARMAVAHGQMKEHALEKAMGDFVDGKLDVLCSTAIVESGLDIPRANTIIINRADMFGLAQLYQLRGRVGRASERAYCYLVTPPVSRMTEEARFRIEALERFTALGSGFHIASLDMELRGTGDMLGAEQSGNVTLVGMELFIQMLEEAVAELRGQPLVRGVDPELTLDVDLSIPESYVDDVGIRLSLYKRLAMAADEDEVQALGTELEDRFGAPPLPTRQLIRAMALKPLLRDLRVLGCEATMTRVTLHLRPDTRLDPTEVLARVASPGSPMSLSPEMKLTRRFERGEPGDCIDRVRKVLDELGPMRTDHTH